jgi:hypothetical protein
MQNQKNYKPLSQWTHFQDSHLGVMGKTLYPRSYNEPLTLRIKSYKQNTL